jgi:hypothetical protein
MKQYLHAVDYVLWALVITGQLFLFCDAIRRRIASDLPHFTLLLGLLTSKSILLLFISFFFNYEVYFYAYYVGSVLVTLGLVLVAYEIFRLVFAPLGPLTAHTISKMICTLIVLLGAAIAAAIWRPSENSDPIFSVILTCERSVGFVVCFSYWLLVLFAHQEGSPRRSRVARITYGFLLYLTVQALVYALVGYVPESVGSLLNRVATVAYLGGLGFWVAALRAKEIRFGPASMEDLLLLKAYIHDLGLAALRLRTITKQENPNEQ